MIDSFAVIRTISQENKTLREERDILRELLRKIIAQGIAERGQLITEYDRDVLRLEAELKRIKEESDEFEKLCTTDSLTRLPNLRYYGENGLKLLRSIRWEWDNGQRKPSSIVYVDIDSFKPINDQLGHDFGDTILRVLSEIFRNTTRRNDIIARIGGDEFVIILHQKGKDEAIRFARRIAFRFKEASGDIIPRESSIAPGLSFGIYSFTGGDLESNPAEEDVLTITTRKAEMNLRHAKNSGKGIISWMENWDFGTEKCLD